MPDLFRIDEDLGPDAQQAIYCISLVILALMLSASLGFVISLVILIEVDPIDFQQFYPQAMQFLSYHRFHRLGLGL